MAPRCIRVSMTGDIVSLGEYKNFPNPRVESWPGMSKFSFTLTGSPKSGLFRPESPDSTHSWRGGITLIIMANGQINISKGDSIQDIRLPLEWIQQHSLALLCIAKPERKWKMLRWININLNNVNYEELQKSLFTYGFFSFIHTSKIFLEFNIFYEVIGCRRRERRRKLAREKLIWHKLDLSLDLRITLAQRPRSITFF